MNDHLSSQLKAWTPKPVSSVEIRAGVWQRIERTETSPWRARVDFFLLSLTNPALATGLVMLAIMAGLALGTVTAETAQTQAYLHSVTMFRALP